MSDGSKQASKFELKLAERKARDAAIVAEAQKPPVEHDADLVPDDPYERSDADLEMDRVIKGIGIIEAYRKWCAKMVPRARPGQVEGVRISCPIPGHVDEEPSAWVNTETNEWFCGRCDAGGDVIELAAYCKGYSVPEYKQGATFHKLRKEMAEDFGYVIKTHIGGIVTITPPPVPVAATNLANTDEPGQTHAEELPDKTGQTGGEPTSDRTEAEIIESLWGDDDNPLLPSFDWRAVVLEDTFMDEYMKCAMIDDVPEEFHFWHGMLALGFALGRDVRLFDMVPVYANLFICTLGRSGSGKSKASRHLKDLLTTALSYDHTNDNSKGVKIIEAPGSAEVLIHNFEHPVYDPTNPKIVLYQAPVRGMVEFNELSALIGRSNRIGNTLKPTLMSFYDMQNEVSTSSLTTGRKLASSPFSSALTSTQPRALKDLISNSDDASGFLNRWVFVSGRDKEKFAIGGRVVDMAPAVKPLQEIQAWASTFMPSEFVTWSSEAAERFTEFFHEVIQRDKLRAQNDLIVRVDLLMKKLILLLAANEKLKEVSLEVVEKAISMYQYLLDCYGIPAAQIGNTIDHEIQQALIACMESAKKRGKNGVTIRDVMRSLAKRKYPLYQVERILNSLVKLDMVEAITTKPDRGPTTVRYQYNA